MLDIQWDQGELSRNAEIILQASTSTEAENIEQAYKILNNKINIFIKNYDIAIKEINEFQNKLKNIIKEWHKIKQSIVAKTENYKTSNQYQKYLEARQSFMKENFTNSIKETTLNIYLSAFEIQEYLNAVLGQKVITAYVFQQSGEIAPQVLLSSNMKDFLNVQISSSGNLILRYRENQNNLNNHINKLQQAFSIDSNDNNNYQKLIGAYNKAHIRYKNFPAKKKHGSYILWLYPYGGQKWNGAYVSSFGSINQSYAYYLLNLKEFNPSSALEDDMEIFMNYLLENVTNESGMLTGDFQNGIAQIAVKSADASVLGIKQIYNLAKKIQTQTNFQEIVKTLKSQKKKNTDKARPINKSLKEALQNIGEKYMPDVINSLQK